MANSQEQALPLVADRFQCDRLLKKTKDSCTFLGNDRKEGKPVIIKLAYRDRFAPETQPRLDYEASLLKQLRSPYVTPLLEAGMENGYLFQVRAFLPGVTLDIPLGRGPLSVLDSLTIGKSLMSALLLSHEKGILHRALKPSNIIVAEDSPLAKAILTDFSLAPSSHLEISQKVESIHPIRYLSPEQAGLVDQVVDERSDLYSAGIILYECLAGRCPYRSEDLGELLREHLTAIPEPVSQDKEPIPAALDEVVRHLLNKDPADRYQTAKAALSDLCDIAEAVRQPGRPIELVVGKSDRRHVLTEPAFIGRREERRTLEQSLEEAAQGKGGLILLETESGGGKTRLLEEFARKGISYNSWTAWGQGLDQTAQRPFQIFAGIAKQIANPTVTSPEQLRVLREQLTDCQEAVGTALPELAGALHLNQNVTLGPEGFGEIRSLDGLKRFLDVLGSPSRPALVILDDCQWADALTARLLQQWQERRNQDSAPCYVLIVAAFRSEEVGPDHILRSIVPHKHVVLPPLDHDEVQELIESMAGPTPTGIETDVSKVSGGNPFMAAAALRGLVESGALVPGASGWRVEGAQMKVLQSSFHSAQFIVGRMELLPLDARALLSAGAVLGKEFDLDFAALLAGQSRQDSDRSVAEARRRHILWVNENSANCSFVHDKLREAFLSRLTKEKRQALHRMAGEYLEKNHRNRPFELAYHYDAAGLCDRALPFALAAASSARAQHSLDVAEQQYRIALRGVRPDDTASRKQILEGMGDVFLLRGNYELAEGHFKEVLELAETDLAKALLRGKLGELEFKRGNVAEASASIEKSLRLLGRYVPRSTLTYTVLMLWEASIQVLHSVFPRFFLSRKPRNAKSELEFHSIRLLSRLAYVYWFQKGKTACGWAHLREMNLAERYPPSPELAQAYSEHAPVMTMVPYFRRAIQYAEKSHAIRIALGDLWGQAQSLHFHGVALYAASQFEKSIEKCQQAARLLQKTGDRWEANTANWHVGFALYRLGRLKEAVEMFRLVYEAGMQIGDHQATAISLSGWSKAANGQIPHDLIQNELARTTGDVHTQLELLQGESIRLLRERRSEEAIRLLRKTHRKVIKSGFQSEYVAPVLPLLATALRSEIEKAKQECASVRWRSLLRELDGISRKAVASSLKYRNNLPHALRERSLVFAMQAKVEKAKQALHGSLKVARKQGAVYEIAQTLLVKDRLGRELGWPLIEEEFAESQRLLASFEASSGPVREGIGSPTEQHAPTLSLVDRFDTLMDIGRQIATSLSPEDVFSSVEKGCLRLLRAENCLLLKWNEQLGRATPMKASLAFNYSEELVRHAMETGKTVVFVEDPSKHTPDSLALSGVRSALCTPFYSRGKKTGCFYLVHHKVGSLFGDEESRLADFIATLTGAALENAENFAELQRLNHDLEKGMETQKSAEIKLKRYASQLRRSNGDLQQFAYVASHDLKEPLRMVTNYVELLAESYSDKLDAEAHTFIKFAVEGASRMSQLIEALLDYSRVGIRNEDSREIDFNEVLQITLSNLQSSIAETGATISSAPLPKLWADKVQMVQLFQNLVGNAIKFRGAKPPEIRIGCENTDGNWQFSVSDNGIGIDPQYADRIFVIFQRLHQREQYPGTGIGLAICKKTVQQLGGRIWVESQPGKGATFYFTILAKVDTKGTAERSNVIAFPTVTATPELPSAASAKVRLG